MINTRRVGAAWRAAAHARRVALVASRAPIPAYYRQREVAAIVLELDVAKDPKRAMLSWASHLARGKWMTESGLSLSPASRAAELSTQSAATRET